MLIPSAVTTNIAQTTGSWTPSLTGGGGTFALGTGSIQEGRYIKMGRLVFIWGFIKFGSSGVNQGSGNYRISGAPFTFSASMQDGTNSDTGNPIMGTVQVWDDSGSVARHGVAGRWITEDQAFVVLIDSASTANLFLGAGQPWAWAALDHVSIQAIYETDQ